MDAVSFFKKRPDLIDNPFLDGLERVEGDEVVFDEGPLPADHSTTLRVRVPNAGWRRLRDEGP